MRDIDELTGRHEAILRRLLEEGGRIERDECASAHGEIRWLVRSDESARSDRILERTVAFFANRGLIRRAGDEWVVTVKGHRIVLDLDRQARRRVRA